MELKAFSGVSSILHVSGEADLGASAQETISPFRGPNRPPPYSRRRVEAGEMTKGSAEERTGLMRRLPLRSIQAKHPAAQAAKARA